MPRGKRPDPVSPAALGGPPVGEELCKLSDLQDRQALVISFGEGPRAREIFLMARGGQVLAYVNDCPHRHLPLNFHPDKFLTPDEDYILCTNHIALFRIGDGHCEDGPCQGEWLTPVAIRVEGDRVLAG